MNLHSRMSAIRDMAIRTQHMIEAIDEILFFAGQPEPAPTTLVKNPGESPSVTVYTLQSAVGSIEDFLLTLENKLKTVESAAVGLHNRACHFRDMTIPEEPTKLKSETYADSPAETSPYKTGNSLRQY